jgi:ABC-type sugar transport system substrate-binding protein
MGKKLRGVTVSLVVIGLAVAVAACGGNGDDGDGASGDIKLRPDDQAYIDYQNLSTDEKLHTGLPCTGSSDSAVAPSPEEAAGYQAPKADSEYTIGFMEPTLAGHYYQAGSSGAFKAADEAGVKLEFVSAGTGYASPEQQLRQADQLIQKGVDAVAIIPTDIQGGVSVTNRFLDEDIPVVIVATEAGSPDAYMVMQDDYQMGKDSADLVAEALGEDAGPGIVIAGPANATWSAKRAAGFADRVEEKYPGIEIVASPTQNVDPALGLKSFENAVQGNPEINWVYTVFNLLLDPDSLPSQYRDVTFVTNGLDPATIEDLEQDQVAKVIGITPTPMGYQGVGHAVSILNGDQDVPALVCIPLTVYEKADLPPDDTAKTLELIQAGYAPK